jgi:excisionase family DNA binding protein
MKKQKPLERLTVRQAAEELGISMRRVQKLIQDERLPVDRVTSRFYLIRPADLDLIRERKLGRPKRPIS